MKLIYTKAHGKTIKAGDPVMVGDRVLTFRGNLVTVRGFNPPHKPSSSGKVHVEEDGHSREFSVGVIEAEWVEREDRAV